VQKARDKAWHDRYIKKKMFKEGDLVLMYDIKSLQHKGKQAGKRKASKEA
jgi:hypothetical protein